MVRLDVCLFNERDIKREYDNQIPRFNVFMVGTTATLIEKYLPDEEFNKNVKIIMKKIQKNLR